MMGLLKLLLSILSSFFKEKQEGQLIDAGKAEAVAANQTEVINEIQTGTTARAEQVQKNVVDLANARAAAPDGQPVSLPDDGYRRD